MPCLNMSPLFVSQPFLCGTTNRGMLFSLAKIARISSFPVPFGFLNVAKVRPMRFGMDTVTPPPGTSMAYLSGTSFA